MAEAASSHSRSSSSYTVFALPTSPAIVQALASGDEAVQPRVLCFVDDTHAAATQLLDDPMGDRLRRRRRALGRDGFSMRAKLG